MKSTFAFFVIFLVANIQGKPSKFPQSRIVGGKDATPGEFPSQLSLQFYLIHKCGASVLSKDWALTAAHCVDGSAAFGHTLLAGSISLTSGGSQHNVVEMVIHEDYDFEDSLKNDIAVLKVDPPFDIDGVNVKPITLASDDPVTGSNVTVIGWGEASEDGVISNTLKEVENVIQDHDTCAAEYSSQGQSVFDTNICAGNGDQGVCTGDLGGPLLIGETTYGIASHSIGCARPGIDAVFTKISAYRDWIHDKTGM